MNKNIDFSEFSTKELVKMIKELDSFTIPDDALIRKIARKVYNLNDSDDIIINQMLNLALPIAIELSNRIIFKD